MQIWLLFNGALVTFYGSFHQGQITSAIGMFQAQTNFTGKLPSER